MPKTSVPQLTRRLVQKTRREWAACEWVLDEAGCSLVRSFLALSMSPMADVQEAFEARAYDLPGETGPILEQHGSVAVVHLDGMMMPRANAIERFYLGATSTREVGDALAQAAANPKVDGILLHINSPGGMVSGMQGLAAAIRSAAAAKPLVAYGEELVASGGYWAASQAPRIIVESGTQVGSIGVMRITEDWSKRLEEMGVSVEVHRTAELKNRGATIFEPLDETARASIRSSMQTMHGQFTAAVAQGRAVTVDVVEKDFGRGGLLIAEDAVGRGMVDAVGSFEDALGELRQASLSARRNSGGARRGSGSSAAAAAGSGRDSGAKEGSMNAKLKAQLFALGLVAAVDVDDETAMAALSGYCRGRGIDATEDDDAMLAALQAPAAPAAPATPAAPVAGDAPSTPAATPAPAPGADAVTAERTRVATIRSAGRGMGVAEATIDAAIDGGQTVDAAVESFRAAMADQRPPVRLGNVTNSGAVRTLEAALQGALIRLDSRVENPSEEAVAWSNRPHFLLSAARAHFQAAGCRGWEDLSAEDLSRAAIGLPVEGFDYGARMADPGMMAGGAVNAPTNFPTLLNSIIRKYLEPGLQEYPPQFDKWARKIDDLPDFKPTTLLQLGEFAEFPELYDGEPFKETTTAEEVGWIEAADFGVKWKLTPRMIANDSLGALRDKAMEMRMAHDQTLNRLIVSLVSGNQPAPDGVALFHTDHGNVITTGGGAPDISQLSAMRNLLARQTGISGHRVLNLDLGSLLVPIAHRTATEQVLADLKYAPTSLSGVNVFAGAPIDVVAEPILEDKPTDGVKEWYGVARGIARPIVYAYRSGFRSMKTERRVDFDTRCMEWSFLGSFGAAIRSYRGICRNSGAA